MVKRLLSLNGLAVLGAVINHASGWGFTAMFWWTDRYQAGPVPDFSGLGTASYYALRAAEQLIMFSIPAFLFVSGFFVAFATGRRRESLGWKPVGVRIRDLAIPYIFWSLALLAGKGALGSFDRPLGYLQSLAFGRAAAPYYYVPLLAQYFLFSPLIVPLVRKHWKPVLLSAGLLQLTVHVARYPVLLGRDVAVAQWVVIHSPGWFFPQTCFWFVFGAFAGFHLSVLKGWLVRWAALLPALTLVSAVLAFLEWELLFGLSGREWLPPAVTALDSIYAGAMILTFIAFDDLRPPFTKQLGELGARSFGVYLMHAPVLEVASRAAYHGAPWILGHQFLFQPLLTLAGVGVPLAAMIAIDRSPVRRCYKYIFG
ncbi:MAG: acyltransferase [Acidobacteria bacterium]|nr:acyltransferase [Acidobacteriota bacterium]